MIVQLSTKGQVVVPLKIRRQMQIEAGDKLNASLEQDRLVLTPHREKRGKARFVTSRKTGLMVCSPESPKTIVPHDVVRAALADFP